MSSLSEPPIPAGTRMIDPLRGGTVDQVPGAQAAANKLIERNAKYDFLSFSRYETSYDIFLI